MADPTEFDVAEAFESVVHLEKAESDSFIVASESFSARSRLLARMLLRTGMRLGEALPMACSQIRPEKAVIALDRSMTAIHMLDPDRKAHGRAIWKKGTSLTIYEIEGGKYVRKRVMTPTEAFKTYQGGNAIVKRGLKRSVPIRLIPILDKTLLDALTQLCGTHPGNQLIFPGETGEEPLTEEQGYRIINKMMRMAGIPPQKRHPHALRHTFAVDFLRKGGDIVSLARILGHGTPQRPNIKTTSIYLQFVVDDLRATMEKFGIGF